MRKLGVFNSVSIDGYFTGPDGDLRWAHAFDPEWMEWVSSNAESGGTMLFGRVTYDMMKSYWPTPAAMENMPVVAEGMNKREKIVFSRTITSSSWSNTRIINSDIEAAVRALKNEPGDDMIIMGSGSVISQLAAAHLIDSYQLVVVPKVLGSGRTMFESVSQSIGLELKKSRSFTNGNIVLWYEATE